jgi:hypothetical protein
MVENSLSDRERGVRADMWIYFLFDSKRNRLEALRKTAPIGCFLTSVEGTLELEGSGFLGNTLQLKSHKPCQEETDEELRSCQPLWREIHLSLSISFTPTFRTLEAFHFP